MPKKGERGILLAFSSCFMAQKAEKRKAEVLDTNKKWRQKIILSYFNHLHFSTQPFIFVSKTSNCQCKHTTLVYNVRKEDLSANSAC